MNQRIRQCFLNKLYFVNPFVLCKMSEKKMIKSTRIKIPMGHISDMWTKGLQMSLQPLIGK